MEKGDIGAYIQEHDEGSRPYKLPFDYIMAYRIIVEGNERIKPQHFDPKLLELFKDTHKSFEKIYDHYKDVPASFA